MATPAEIADAARCFVCLPNRSAAVVYLLNQMSASAFTGGGTPPAEINACDSVNDAFLKAYWRLDEVGGTRFDTKGINHLTDNNTVTSAAGKISNAAQFTAVNSESLSIADNADLSLGSSDLFISVWVNAATLPALAAICGKWNTGHEYLLYYDGGISRFVFAMRRADDGSTFFATANTFGAPAISTWYHVMGWVDLAAQTVNISINNSPVDSSPAAASGRDTGDAFEVGSFVGGLSFWNGLLDELLVSRRILTDDERAALYNFGNGCRPAGL